MDGSSLAGLALALALAGVAGCATSAAPAPASPSAPPQPAPGAQSQSQLATDCRPGPCPGVWIWSGTACEPLRPDDCARFCASPPAEHYTSFDLCRNAHFFPFGGGPTPPAGPP